MTIFLTSDTHFGHEKVIGFCNRPFSCAEEMDEGLIANWNEIVGPKDTVYHLGDFAFLPKGEVGETFRRLNGKKYLIRGNHDSKPVVTLGWEWVKDYYELKHNKQKYVLMHFPIESWNRQRHGSWHFHGHTHGNQSNDPIQPLDRRVDVGVDCWNYRPVPLDLFVSNPSVCQGVG